MATGRVSELSQVIQELTERIERLASDPMVTSESARELLDALRRAERDRRRALADTVRGLRQPARANAPQPSASGGRTAADPFMPVRERVLAGLDLLGAPSRGGLVSVAASARTGLPVHLRQLASLRRSELASWRAAPDRRPAYLVPALHVRRFEPLRGIVASSSWEPWRRLVGPLSARTDHLRATIRVAEHLMWASKHSADFGSRFERLLRRLARSVPGAIDTPELDVERVVAAARAELSVADGEDRAERQAAAERAAGLSAEEQLFGAGLRAIQGGAS